MARTVGILSARKAETLTAPGRHADGGNLYLSISGNGGRRWTFYYRFNGKRREMGLGSAHKGHVSLAEARGEAAKARALVNAGLDPLIVRHAEKAAARVIPNFGPFADEYITTMRRKWRNDKHAAQWGSTLATYCQKIHDTPINAVDTEAVLSVLQPIWQTIPETASRLRGRIENILDAAKARGFLQGENPARWRGHLKALLPARRKLTRGHHKALAYAELPAFMAQLRSSQSASALALEFCILTAARSGEVLKAQWPEIDLDKAIWTVPPERMKAAKEHRVPLSPRAVALLKALPRMADESFLFPGNKQGKPLSEMAMTMQLRRMGHDDITCHGFRSTFRDWASEATSFPHEVCEMALAHVIKNKAEAAYRRGDLFVKRRKLMEAWATFAEHQKMTKVVPLIRGNTLKNRSGKGAKL